MNKIKEIESLETFKEVTKELIDNLYNVKCLSNTDVEHITISASKELRILLDRCNFDFNKVGEILIDDGWDKDRVGSFILDLEDRKSDLLYEKVLQYNSEFGEVLIDFDWLLKLVKGTDSLKKLSYPFLQLILSTIEGQKNKKHVLDINKEMLCKLIKLLENVD